MPERDEQLHYAINEWSPRDDLVQVHARINSFSLAVEAFLALARAYPGRLFTLQIRARVIRRSDEPAHLLPLPPEPGTAAPAR